MDPFTAVGLASAIVQFVDFGIKVIRGAKGIPASESARSLEHVADEMQRLAVRLSPLQTPPSQLTDDERALSTLAGECQTVANQIVGLLQRNKPADPRKRKILLASIRSVWSERDRQDLEKRLDSCRSQLELQLAHMSRSEMRGRLTALSSTINLAEVRLEVIQDNLKQLTDSVSASVIGLDSQQRLREIMDVYQAAHTTILQRKALSCLEFADMHDRFDAVDEAHFKTFHWIFDHERRQTRSHGIALTEEDSDYGDNSDNSVSYRSDEAEYGDESERNHGRISSRVLPWRSKDEDEEEDELHWQSEEEEEEDEEEEDELPWQIEERQKLISWLAAGNGIFHVAGKFGSGKSTLMKFLCQHNQTTEALRQWSGPKNLVFAQFFFWKHGDQMQRSLDGLLRALLFGILKSCPDLLPDLLPSLWEEISSIPWQAQSKPHIHSHTIRGAFQRLIQMPACFANNRVCIFIDGLDEYDETPQTGYRDLIQLLHCWVVSARDDVKLCVSSRDYNVFMDAFPESKRIRLQCLNRDDIKAFADERLRLLEDDSERLQLVNSIVEKADGVFLWAGLVVRELGRRIEDGYELSSLRRELDIVPEEMEALFEYLFAATPRYMRQTLLCIADMLNESHQFHLRLPALAVSFLDDYFDDPDFAMKPSFRYSAMDMNALDLRVAKAERQVTAEGRGFLECQNSIDEFVTGRSLRTVAFAHRSTADFLLQKRATIGSCQEFDTAIAISQLGLATVRTVVADGIAAESQLSQMVAAILGMREKRGMDCPPFSYLSHLEAAVPQHYPSGQSRTSKSYATLMVSVPSSLNVESTWHGIMTVSDSGDRSMFSASPFLICSGMLVAKLRPYALWWAQQNFIRISSNLTLLSGLVQLNFHTLNYPDRHFVLTDVTHFREAWLSVHAIFCQYLQKGLPPSTPICCPNFTSNQNCFDDEEQVRPDHEFRNCIQLWEWIVLVTIKYFLQADRHAEADSFHFIGMILEAFLSWNAEVDLIVKLTTSEHEVTLRYCSLGGTRREVKSKWTGGTLDPSTSGPDVERHLVDWVRLMELDNEKTVLALIEARLQRSPSLNIDDNTSVSDVEAEDSGYIEDTVGPSAAPVGHHPKSLPDLTLLLSCGFLILGALAVVIAWYFHDSALQ